MSKIKLLTIVGARPQIIKAAAISRAIRHRFADTVEERILHTGQHYDQNMSAVFFEELGIPAPDYNLGVGSASHGQQTARMIAGIEEVLQGEHFDGMIVYGDTNSTLAASVAAIKQHVPIFHVEAGLRSYNMAMPEEINRIMCDQASSILFCPTQTAIDNLTREGLADSPALFPNGKGRVVCNCGDVMFDNSLYFATLAPQKTDILEREGLTAGGYILATVHRDTNTDNPEKLDSIFRALLDIAEQHDITVVMPLHPRTRKLMQTNLSLPLQQRIAGSRYLKVLPPASFFEMIELERNARCVMTDSGGVQKEAFFFHRPCVILRPETEWVEIVEQGAGIIADADYRRILAAYQVLNSQSHVYPEIFGDGHAAEKIIEKINQYLS